MENLSSRVARAAQSPRSAAGSPKRTHSGSALDAHATLQSIEKDTSELATLLEKQEKQEAAALSSPAKGLEATQKESTKQASNGEGETETARGKEVVVEVAPGLKESEMDSKRMAELVERLTAQMSSIDAEELAERFEQSASVLARVQNKVLDVERLSRKAHRDMDSRLGAMENSLCMVSAHQKNATDFLQQDREKTRAELVKDFKNQLRNAQEELSRAFHGWLVKEDRERESIKIDLKKDVGSLRAEIMALSKRGSSVSSMPSFSMESEVCKQLGLDIEELKRTVRKMSGDNCASIPEESGKSVCLSQGERLEKEMAYLQREMKHTHVRFYLSLLVLFFSLVALLKIYGIN